VRSAEGESAYEGQITRDKSGRPHESSWYHPYPVSGGSREGCHSSKRKIINHLCIRVVCRLDYAEIVEAERAAKIQSIINVATAEKAAADKLHADALAKIKEKRDADMASLAQKKRDLSASRNSEFLPTVEELANTGIYQQEAQRLQWLEADAKDAALFGDKRGRANDLAEIQSIRSRLSAAGVYQDPNQGTIDAIDSLSKKTLKVDVVNAD